MFITCADNKAEKRSRQAASSDRPIRSLAKAVSWRVTGSIDTILLSWFFTGSLTTAAAIGLTEVVTKMALYYLHERIWNRIPLGRDRCDRYDVTEVLQAESPVA
ncbi:MAG: DUF2061 domain-containing protein [Candidatus Thiodiazotropha sp. (ex Lucina pensylvanica)]|nr:DUF2061 domain-containing protein [Candidatus Thiodiazotropha sp. (ex Lucina pensylvanica)]MBT3050524.1 DUF2061 domain-containing protein [Candidatus Thiodiazotropha sp. (ex Codakia orbicularis)]